MKASLESIKRILIGISLLTGSLSKIKNYSNKKSINNSPKNGCKNHCQEKRYYLFHR